MTLPPLFASMPMSMDFPGSPQARSKGLSLSSAQVQHNDIDAHELLGEIEMDMYAEVFILNFGINDTKYLNRNRLKTLRLQDMPKLGITQYEHQKILHDHISHALEFEFKSPVRRNQVRTKMELRFPDRSFGPATGGAGEFTAQKLHKLRVEDLQIPERELKKVPHSANQEKITTRRRRSFDQNVWKSITHLRTTDIENTAASNELRNGHVDAMVKIEKKLHDSRRRRSFDHKHGGTQFGNRALGADLVHKELHDLQTRHMKKLKQILGCAEANIMFIHAKTRDLLLVTDHMVWYRLPIGFSIPGQCAESGMVMNVEDAYSDQFFNSNLDEKIGVRSRQVLCYPLRANRGAGAIIGVIQCTNKNEGFDSSDEEVLAKIAEHICEDLVTKFSELTSIADIMHGAAIPVQTQGGLLGNRRAKGVAERSTVVRSTAASLAQQTHIYEHGKGDQGIHSVHEKRLNLG